MTNTGKNNKLMLLATVGIMVLFVVGIMIYVNKNQMTKYTDFSSDEEFENATVVLDIPEGELGEAPGTCKLTLISKSSLYPVEISDITKFYEFSDTVTNCENGSMTVYNPETKLQQNVAYVSITINGTTEGVTKTDPLTGVIYSVKADFTNDILNVSLNIEDDENGNKDEVVRSILLTEVEEVFGEFEESVLSSFNTLEDLGLTLNN